MKRGAKHGLWIEVGDSKWKLLESIYRDGVRQGPYREWHQDGWLLESGTFVDGEKEGDVEFFARDGRRIAMAAHHTSKWHGRYTQFMKDGSIELEREYRDGTIFSGPYDLKSHHGDHYSWRKTYKDGHPIGLWEENDYKGQPQRRRTYDDDGVLHGPWSDHHEGGAVNLEGTYTRGERTGTWTSRRPDGSVVASSDYDGDRVWRAHGAAIDLRDDADFERWMALAAAWDTSAYHLEKAIDAWPDDDRERAVAWVEARYDESPGKRRLTAGGMDWLAVLLRHDDDPRTRLIDAISTDHDEWQPEHVARVVRSAAVLRELSIDEVHLADVDALFPPGVAWPNLARLWIHECGPLGTLVRTLADAPWTTSLRDLGLDGSEGSVSDDDAVALIASSHLAQLESLYLSCCGGGAAFARAIATAPMFDRLERFELRSPRDPVGCVEAIAARETPNLKTLELYGEGKLSRNTIASLCAKARHPVLESITLQAFDVSDAIVDEIKRSRPTLRFSIY